MRGERHNLSMLIFPSAPYHHTCCTHPQTTGLVSASPESQPSSSVARTQLTAFSQIPKSSAHTSGAWFHWYPLVPITVWDFILTSLNDTSSPYAWTPALMLHRTNQGTKRKVLILTNRKARYTKRNPSAIILQRHLGILHQGHPRTEEYSHSCSLLTKGHV